MNRTRPPLPARRGGFTLLELLVVLAVLGLGLAIAAPRFAAGQPALQARSAARQVVAGLQSARNLAITENRTVQARVERAPHAVVVEGRRRELPGSVRFEVDDETPEQRLQPIAVSFFPDGGSSGGRLVVAVGAHRYLVLIDWLTGAIEARVPEDGNA